MEAPSSWFLCPFIISLSFFDYFLTFHLKKMFCTYLVLSWPQLWNSLHGALAPLVWRLVFRNWDLGCTGAPCCWTVIASGTSAYPRPWVHVDTWVLIHHKVPFTFSVSMLVTLTMRNLPSLILYVVIYLPRSPACRQCPSLTAMPSSLDSALHSLTPPRPAAARARPHRLLPSGRKSNRSVCVLGRGVFQE